MMQTGAAPTISSAGSSPRRSILKQRSSSFSNGVRPVINMAEIQQHPQDRLDNNQETQASPRPVPHLPPPLSQSGPVKRGRRSTISGAPPPLIFGPSPLSQERVPQHKEILDASRRVSFSVDTPQRTATEILRDQASFGIVATKELSDSIAAQQEAAKHSKGDILKKGFLNVLDKILLKRRSSMPAASDEQGVAQTADQEEQKVETAPIKSFKDWLERRKGAAQDTAARHGTRHHHQLDAPEMSNPQKVGFMLVKSWQKYGKENWTMQYCLLKKRWLFIMTPDKDSQTASHIINLTHCVLDTYPKSCNAFCLRRLGHERSYAFETEDLPTKLAWMEHLLSNIHEAWKEDQQLRRADDEGGHHSFRAETAGDTNLRAEMAGDTDVSPRDILSRIGVTLNTTSSMSPAGRFGIASASNSAQGLPSPTSIRVSGGRRYTVSSKQDLDHVYVNALSNASKAHTKMVKQVAKTQMSTSPPGHGVVPLSPRIARMRATHTSPTSSLPAGGEALDNSSSSSMSSGGKSWTGPPSSNESLPTSFERPEDAHAAAKRVENMRKILQRRKTEGDSDELLEKGEGVKARSNTRRSSLIVSTPMGNIDVDVDAFSNAFAAHLTAQAPAIFGSDSVAMSPDIGPATAKRRAHAANRPRSDSFDYKIVPGEPFSRIKSSLRPRAHTDTVETSTTSTKQGETEADFIKMF